MNYLRRILSQSYPVVITGLILLGSFTEDKAHANCNGTDQVEQTTVGASEDQNIEKKSKQFEEVREPWSFRMIRDFEI